MLLITSQIHLVKCDFILLDFEPTALSLQGKVVSDYASTDVICKHALAIFVAAYGAEAGNAALKYLPAGGLFLAGGLTPKNLKHLEGEHSGFMQAFRDKGRLSGMILKVPVYAVLDEQLGQRGAHYFAVRLLKEQQQSEQQQQQQRVEGTAKTSSSGVHRVQLMMALTAGAAAGLVAAKYLISSKR